MRGRVGLDVGLFVVLCAVFTAPFWWLIVVHRGSAGTFEVGFGLMWGPSAAAFVVGRAADMGWRWPARRDLALGLGLPVAYLFGVYGFAWAAGFSDFFTVATVASYLETYKVTELGQVSGAVLALVWALTVQLGWNAAYALGEEIGWRGFLVPALSRRLGLVATGLVSGAIWAAWHFPLMAASRHEWTPWRVGCFTTMVMSLGVTLTWLRLRSGSLWPAVALHAMHNSLLGYLDSMAGDTGAHGWFYSETGLGLAVANVAIAVVVVVVSGRDRRRLSATSQT